MTTGDPPPPGEPDDAGQQEPHSGKGNGQTNADPLADAFSDAGAGSNGTGEDWRAELPTENMARSNPLRILEPERLEAMARFRAENLADYYGLLDRLAAASTNKLITRAKIDEHVSGVAAKQRREERTAPGKGEEDKSPMKILMEIFNTFALSSAKGKVGFVDYTRDGHVETSRISDNGFTEWFGLLYYEKTGQPAPLEALNAVLRLMQAKARFRSPKRDIDLRVNTYVDGNGDRVFLLDLGQDDWSYVKATRHGWEVRARQPTEADPSGMDGAPVRMHRSDSMLPLPIPTRGTKITALAPFLGIEESTALTSPTFVLAVGWVMVAIVPWGLFFLLLLNGPPGALKSSIGKRLTGIVDPHIATERTMPGSTQDLAIAARHNMMLFFDNVMEQIPRSLAPAICMSSTGGAHATRTLYSNDGETVHEFMRALAFAGTRELFSETEIAERGIQLLLEKPETPWRDPLDVEADWVKAHPGILGAVLDAVVAALAAMAAGANGPSSNEAATLRMAGSVAWVEACESALGWGKGVFTQMYVDNLSLGAERVIDADRVLTALEEFLLAQPEITPGVRVWQGSATKLLDELNSIVGPGASRSKEWPKLPHALSQKLRNEVAPALEKRGIVVVQGPRKHGGGRSLTATHTQGSEISPENPKPASPASPKANIPTSEQKMPYTTARNGSDAGDAPGGEDGDAGMEHHQVDRKSGDAATERHPERHQERHQGRNPGKRPVPEKKIDFGDAGDPDFSLFREKEVSGSLSSLDPALVAGGASKRATTPKAQHVVNEPPKPGRRVRIKAQRVPAP